MSKTLLFGVGVEHGLNVHSLFSRPVVVLIKILTCPSISEHDVGKSWVSFLNPVKSKLKFGGFEWAKPTHNTI